MNAPNLRTRRSALNYVAGLGYTAATMLIALFTTPLLLHWLGEERYGAVRATTDWFTHLGIFELGLMGALPPLLARTLGKGDQDGLHRMMAAGVRAYFWVAAFAITGGVLITLFITRLVPVSAGLVDDLRLACLLGLLGLLFLPFAPFRWLADAEQRGYVVSGVLLVQSLLTTGLALLFARTRPSIAGQLLALSLGQVVGALLFLAASRSRVPRLTRALAAPPDAGTVRALRDLNWPTLWFLLSGRLGLLTDNIVIAAMLGPIRVVPLYLTQRLLGLATSQLQAVGGASWAALAELHALGRRDIFNARLLDLTRLVAGLAVATLLPIAAFNQGFVTRWVGVTGFGGDLVTALAAANGFLLALVSLWAWVFSGTGNVRRLVVPVLISAVINLAVSIGATRAIGLAGPLIGTLVGLGGIQAWYLPLALQRDYGTPALALVRAAAQPLLWGLPIGAGLAFLAHHHPPRGWLELGAAMAASAAILLVFWWFFALTDAERISFRERLAVALARQRP